MTLTVKFGRWKDNLRKLQPISYKLCLRNSTVLFCRKEIVAIEILPISQLFFSVSLFSDLLRHLTFLKKSFFSSFFPIKFGNSPIFTFYLTLLSTFWEFFGVLVTNCKFWLQVFIQLNPLLDGFLFPSRSYWL